MKAELIALTGFAVLAVVGGAVGYNYWLAQDTERAVDAAIEQHIAASALGAIPRPNNLDGAESHWLEAFYAKPDQKAALDASYAALRAAWRIEAPRLAQRRSWFSQGAIDEARLGLEIDERFGAGAFALMAGQDEQRRQAAIVAERERLNLEDLARALADQDMDAVRTYIDATGHYPPAGSRIVNGRVVEP